MSRRSSSRSTTPRYTTNPKTGREIEIGGKTYLEIARDPKYRDKLRPKPSKAQSTGPRGHSYSNSTRGGCSNAGKYKDVPSNLFCGPVAGSCPGTFPVNTPGRARAALSYRRHSNNPQKLEECVIRIAKKKGWYDEKTGTIKVSKSTKNPRRASTRKSNNQLSKNTSRKGKSKSASKKKSAKSKAKSKITTRKHNFGCGCGA